MSSESSLDHSDFQSKSEISKRCETVIKFSETFYPRYDLNYFRGRSIFTNEEIDRDIIRTENIKKSFSQSDNSIPKQDKERILHSKKRSDALEIIIADQIETGDWFGGEALFFRTTEFDDYFNGVDAVVEFENNNHGYIALAIDSTSKTELHTLAPKIDRNISKILTNRVEVKYFQSPRLDNPYVGSLTDTVPVVIGLESQNTNDLITSFSRLIDLNRASKDETSNSNLRTTFRNEYNQLRKRVEKDPTQLIFLEEIKVQLEMYQSILNHENNQNIHLSSRKLQEIIQIIKDIISEKEPIRPSLEVKIPQGDAVFDLIKYYSEKKQATF